MGQGVPDHIGTPTQGHGYESGDPFGGFLPPAIEVNENDGHGGRRAMGIVREQTEKIGQEYLGALLVLSGEEYAAIPFHKLLERICDALRGNRPRLVAEAILPGGLDPLIFEGGSVRERQIEEE